MRTYYAFIIKDSLMHFYSKKPYSLYRILEQIYNLKNNDIVLGYRLLEQVTVPFGARKINLLKVFNSHIKIKSTSDYSSFFNTIKKYNKNIFICDFVNKDYFWVNKIKYQSIV